MFWNYLKIALMNLRKNKLFAVINIGGLAMGFDDIRVWRPAG